MLSLISQQCTHKKTLCYVTSKVISIHCDCRLPFVLNVLNYIPGIYDRQRVMCLIDPQGHTYVRSYCKDHGPLINIYSATRENNNCYEYWDGGPKMLQKFLKKHEPACQDNWICHALNLSGAIIEERPVSPARVAEGSQKRKRRGGDLSFILQS